LVVLATIQTKSAKYYYHYRRKKHVKSYKIVEKVYALTLFTPNLNTTKELKGFSLSFQACLSVVKSQKFDMIKGLKE